MKAYDLTGQRFGRLLCIRKVGRTAYRASMWQCRCDCGTERVVLQSNLSSGISQSCGCLASERTIASNRARSTHGQTVRGLRSAEYRAWGGMISRCYNPNDKSFKNYGQRGILVCRRWRKSFDNFLADMGRKPANQLSLGRINNNGPYAPWNCRWETALQQSQNRRIVRLLTLGNRTQCVAAWARERGVSDGMIRCRLRDGMTVQEALTRPHRFSLTPHLRRPVKVMISTPLPQAKEPK